MVFLSFTDPVYLWFSFAIPLLILIHFITLRFSRRKAFKFANFETIQRITGGVLLTKNTSLLVIRLIILTSLILAISGAIFNYIGSGTNFKYVLAIDASSSMTAEDIAPSRLAVAKEAAKIFVDEIGSKTSIGIISFAGTPLINEPITLSRANVKNAIDEIRILAIGGTDIGGAIITAINMFESLRDDLGGGKAIVLLTDGRSNVGISIDNAINRANDMNLVVHTIGIGTNEGGLLLGTNVTLKIDEDGLFNLAEKTGGVYFKAETPEQLVESYKQIANIGITKISLQLKTPLLILGLFLLLFEWLLMNTKYRILP
ncbi:VWA domain-containing protein [Candidatus Woesearchaeota archaeon]|nr:VWA domain-containing protein [Candidatus Woesearchaeota archaeon]